mmetsp:Transcript_91525/g.218201  ORF Transcript_91525/g.218201 Transcript_91525/m.218201 type:complete len:209 (-) Transcript_91525:133-759(-)
MGRGNCLSADSGRPSLTCPKGSFRKRNMLGGLCGTGVVAENAQSSAACCVQWCLKPVKGTKCRQCWPKLKSSNFQPSASARYFCISCRKYLRTRTGAALPMCSATRCSKLRESTPSVDFQSRLKALLLKAPFASASKVCSTKIWFQPKVQKTTRSSSETKSRSRSMGRSIDILPSRLMDTTCRWSISDKLRTVASGRILYLSSLPPRE